MTRPALKLCIVAPAPPPYGGIANWTRLLMRHAQRQPGVEVALVDIAPRWRAVHDVGLTKRALGGSMQLVRDFARYAVQLVLHRPDVVHLTTAGELGVVRDIAMVSFARALGVPVAYHIHFGRTAKLAAVRNLEWRMLTRVMRMATVVVALDASTATAVSAELPGTTVVTIPNPVDFSELPAHEAPSSNERRVLYLGWVIPSKGVEELLQAWARARPDGWRLVLMGPVDEDYKARLLETHSPVAVDFAGERDHAAAMEFLVESDIFVLPSHSEGFPYSVLEAMAVGKAIVATSVGAIPEMLRDSCGILVKARSVDELAEALRRAASDAPLRRQMGDRARERAGRYYSIETVFDTYTQLWQSIAR